MSLTRRLASQSAAIFAGRLTGAGFTFLAQAAIARWFGAGVLGEYLLVMAAVNIVAVVMPLGFETTGTYFAAEYRARGQRALLGGFLVRAYGHVAAVALALALLGYPLASLLGDAGAVLRANWWPACLLTLATAIIYVNSAVLVGLGRPYAGYFAEALFRPLAIIAALVLTRMVVAPEVALAGLVGGVAAFYAVVAAMHFFLVLRAAGEVPAADPGPNGEWKRWWRFALPWVLIALAGDYFFDIDLIVLANLMGREELAIFGVCTRIFSLAAFGVAAVYALTMPEMFESEAHDDRAGFLGRVGDANLVASVLALVLFAGAAIGGPLALMLFGPGFMAGAAPLAILCLSLVVRAVMGPATLVLSVHDRPWASLPAVGLGVVTLVTGNLVLVPALGLMGAAWAALIAISVWSGGLWLTVRLTTGVDVSLFGRLRPSGKRAPLAAE